MCCCYSGQKRACKQDAQGQAPLSSNAQSQPRCRRFNAGLAFRRKPDVATSRSSTQEPSSGPAWLSSHHPSTGHPSYLQASAAPLLRGWCALGVQVLDAIGVGGRLVLGLAAAIPKEQRQHATCSSQSRRGGGEGRDECVATWQQDASWQHERAIALASHARTRHAKDAGKEDDGLLFHLFPHHTNQ